MSNTNIEINISSKGLIRFSAIALVLLLCLYALNSYNEKRRSEHFKEYYHSMSSSKLTAELKILVDNIGEIDSTNVEQIVNTLSISEDGRYGAVWIKRGNNFYKIPQIYNYQKNLNIKSYVKDLPEKYQKIIESKNPFSANLDQLGNYGHARVLFLLNSSTDSTAFLTTNYSFE